jgi:hypothetical protein
VGLGRRRDPGTPFPTGWLLGNDELKVANEVCGWNLEKAEQQFDAFETYMLADGRLSSNWPKAWRGWCIRGRDRDALDKRRNRNSFESVVEGLQQWAKEEEEYQQRKRTKH